MPKKTKKEKIIAAYRKKMQLLKQIAQINIPNLPNLPKQTLPKKESPRPVVAVATPDISTYFFHDLRKSLILIAIVVALEISFYFVRIIK